MKVFRHVDEQAKAAGAVHIVACRAEGPPAHQGYPWQIKLWEECDASILDGLEELWTSEGVIYFGRRDPAAAA